MDDSPHQQRILTLIAIALTFAPGATDVASYTRLGDVFASVMTGNIVLLGLAVARHSLTLASHTLVSIAGYITGVAGRTWIARGFRIAGAAADSGEHLAQGGCGGVYIDGGSGDVRQEGMKDHVVLAIEEENMALGSAHFVAKSFCELNGGKAATDDDHSSWVHLDAPVLLLFGNL